MLSALQQRFAAGRDSVGVIGLEFALHGVHMVQLARSDDGSLACVAQSHLPYGVNREQLLDDPAQLKRFLRKAYKAGNFRGKRVVAALPATRVRISSLNYRLASEQEHAEVIMRIMRQRIGDAIDDQVIDFIHVRSEDNSEDRLAVVAMTQRDIAVQLLDNIRGAGLTPVALEINPLAIKRVVVQLSTGPEMDNALAITLGYERSFITVVSGRRLLSDQMISVAETAILADLSKELQIDAAQGRRWLQQYGLYGDETNRESQAAEVAGILRRVTRKHLQALVQDIDRSSVYVASESRGAGIAAIYLLGGIAHWRGIDRLLGELVDIPVRILDPRLVYDGVDGDPIPEATVATGLALRSFRE